MVKKKSTWTGDPKAHSIVGHGADLKRSMGFTSAPPVFPMNPQTQAMILSQRPALQSYNPTAPSNFHTDANLMVNLSNAINGVLTSNGMTEEERKYQVDTYTFAYNYILGATKHYGPKEREAYFSNPKFPQYLVFAYMELTLPNKHDQKKINHFTRNYKRALKDHEKYHQKLKKYAEKKGLILQETNMGIKAIPAPTLPTTSQSSSIASSQIQPQSQDIIQIPSQPAQQQINPTQLKNIVNILSKLKKQSSSNVSQPAKATTIPVEVEIKEGRKKKKVVVPPDKIEVKRGVKS